MKKGPIQSPICFQIGVWAFGLKWPLSKVTLSVDVGHSFLLCPVFGAFESFFSKNTTKLDKLRNFKLTTYLSISQTWAQCCYALLVMMKWQKRNKGLHLKTLLFSYIYIYIYIRSKLYKISPNYYPRGELISHPCF